MKRVFILIAVVAGIAALIYVVDFTALLHALTSMPRRIIGLLILLFLISSTLKGLRWAYYLRAARLNIRWRDGLTSYLAAMAAAPLPGGSLLSPRLAQEHGDIRMRQAAPALFCSFVGDAFAVSILAFFSFAIIGQPGIRFTIPLIGLSIGLGLVLIGRSSRSWVFVARLLNRWQFSKKWLPKEREVQQRVRMMMRTPILSIGTGLSFLITLVSAMYFVLLVNTLIPGGLSVSEGLFVHSASETAQVAIPVPGGFGIAESSLTGMLSSVGITIASATFVALLVRSSDLLLKAIVGSFFLVAFYDDFLFKPVRNTESATAGRSFSADIPGMRFVLQPALAAFAPFRRTDENIVSTDLPVDSSLLVVEGDESE